MRGAILGVVVALGLAGSAAAADYIVVNSTDPAIKRGQAYDARVALGAGKTLTVMKASGEVTTLRGAATGVTLPATRVSAAEAGRFETLKALVEPPAQGRSFGARRSGGVCPPKDSLTSLEDIVKAAETSGCKAVAREALDAYIAKNEGGSAGE
jgi:hypothetical protein